MDKNQYISELQKAGAILQTLFDDQMDRKRKRGNLALLLMYQRHDIEKIIQYIRRNGLDDVKEARREKTDE